MSLLDRNTLGKAKKPPGTFSTCTPEGADFMLKSSSPTGLSLDGVLKDILEWDDSVLKGFWKIASFLIKIPKAGEEREKFGNF